MSEASNLRVRQVTAPFKRVIFWGSSASAAQGTKNCVCNGMQGAWDGSAKCFITRSLDVRGNDTSSSGRTCEQSEKYLSIQTTIWHNGLIVQGELRSHMSLTGVTVPEHEA